MLASESWVWMQGTRCQPEPVACEGVQPLSLAPPLPVSTPFPVTTQIAVAAPLPVAAPFCVASALPVSIAKAAVALTLGASTCLRSEP